MIITSLTNPNIKFVRSLRSKKARDESGLSILEGYRAVSRGMECGVKFTKCYYTPKLFLGKNETALISALSNIGTEIQEVSDTILAKIAYRDRPEGIIGIMKQKKHSLSTLPIDPNGLYIVAESIEKPGNLGSILRSADAVGATGVILCDKRTDIYNPNVITASTGALFSANLAEASAEEAYKWLQDKKIKILAATPEAKKIYSEVNLKEGIAIIVGTEQVGLTDFWKSKANINIKIPMLGYIDSLNVATATTVVMYEAARQREWK
jgi:RNA methyltransferase, TrmH family